VKRKSLSGISQTAARRLHSLKIHVLLHPRRANSHARALCICIISGLLSWCGDIRPPILCDQRLTDGRTERHIVVPRQLASTYCALQAETPRNADFSSDWINKTQFTGRNHYCHAKKWQVRHATTPPSKAHWTGAGAQDHSRLHCQTSRIAVLAQFPA